MSRRFQLTVRRVPGARFLPLPPRLEDVHYNAAVLLARKGQSADAVRHLEAALALAPNDEAARRLREALK